MIKAIDECGGMVSNMRGSILEAYQMKTMKKFQSYFGDFYTKTLFVN